MATATTSKTSQKPRRRRAAKRSASGTTKKVSRLNKPPQMTLEGWQIELRRQFGAEQDFRIKNVGTEPIFSQFQVTNPKSGGSYRVVIRGEQLGVNFCSCPDFVVNTLGTCKHVEFTLAKLRRKRGGRRALADGYQPPYSEVHLHYGAEREVRFQPGSGCPVKLARLAARYFDDEGRLLSDAFERFGTFLSKAAKIEHDLRIHDDVLGLVAEVRDAVRRGEILDAAFRRGKRSAALAKLIKLTLYDYQREGALFAARAGRCLIGDEMGLGKTIQAIAACQIMAGHFGVERVLIVCPTSLKHQWEAEIARCTDRSTEVIGGLRARRQQQFAGESFYKIMNYDTVHRDLDLIQRWGPDLVILDEAQRIKNWQTRTAKSVKKIDSPHCIVLTGTPLENRLEELVSIVQFIDQHRLGPTFRFLHEHQVREDETGKVVGYRNLDRIGESLRPILLRRRKKEVLDQLPERLEKRLMVPMTPQQWQHHEENKEIVARIVAKWQRYHYLSEADQRRLMIALQNMRMSCNSTYLLDKETDFGVKADELATLLEEIYEQPETKVLIFSQWVRTHELLERRFKPRNWDYVFFHGGVASNKRKELVDRFREDPRCRAFLSTDAGGVGLNLQCASVVVNMDMPWNPAVLEQRIGRAHRLGQTQPVRVINFVAQGTIEEGMLSLLQFKKSLFAGVLDGGKKEVFLDGGRLKRFMETVKTATDGIPEAAPAESDTLPSAVPQESVGQVDPSGLPSEAAADPWQGLLQNGLALLGQFAAAAQQTTGDKTASQPQGRGPVEVVRDEAGDPSYLKIPMPKPELVSQALQAIKALTEGMR